MNIRVGIIYGGRSCEHEVSISSAASIASALDRSRYDVTLIGIDKRGHWRLESEEHLRLGKISDAGSREIVPVMQGKRAALLERGARSHTLEIDVFFPVVHGTFGEDGSLQGFLRLLDVPFVGSGVLGSAVGMDKDVMKRLLRDAGIPIARFVTVRDQDRRGLSYASVARELGRMVFVKPCNLGSSVGVAKAASEAEFVRAVDGAFGYDRKILIEEAVHGREIECSVMGNDHPIASVPGEIRLNTDYYSYEAKYLNVDDAILEIPAKISAEASAKVRELSVKVFETLECSGLARVDFFLKDDDDVLVNEINTLPGFTSISMYPKLWEASGVSYTELLHRLVQLAIERDEQEGHLRHSLP